MFGLFVALFSSDLRPAPDLLGDPVLREAFERGQAGGRFDDLPFDETQALFQAHGHAIVYAYSAGRGEAQLWAPASLPVEAALWLAMASVTVTYGAAPAWKPFVDALIAIRRSEERRAAAARGITVFDQPQYSMSSIWSGAFWLFATAPFSRVVKVDKRHHDAEVAAGRAIGELRRRRAFARALRRR